ncbi:MAG: helix-turn-helix domain-containing protein [Bacteroidota bacterium]
MKKNMICPICDSENTVKNGIVKGRQRFLCKKNHAGGNFTVKRKSTSASESQIRLALIMYLLGLSPYDIADKFNKSYPTIKKWIKNYGNELKRIRNKASVTMTETSSTKLSYNDFRQIEEKILRAMCN